MALIKCKNCGKEVSDRASNCIHCGFDIHKNIDIDNKSMELESVHKENEELNKENELLKQKIEEQNIVIKNNNGTNKEIEKLNKENELLKKQIAYSKKIKDIKKEATNYFNKFLDIVRYIFGCSALTCVIVLKPIPIILMIAFSLLIFPFSTRYLYSKVNVPKALRIIIPFILLLLAFIINGPVE